MFDGLVKSPIRPVFVIPAKAGIQLFQWVLDSGFHRSDGLGTSYEIIMFSNFEFVSNFDIRISNFRFAEGIPWED